MVKFVKKITKRVKFHIIQATGKVWADYPINSHAPQRVFPLAQFFEDKSCDLTIQVNFSALAINPKKFLN